ncbi:MAG TPA: thiamine phosphate synthase [Pyrinomonadaceae bacterium]|nr:thiamine phosphate synthase [Pyrinomonadaceae bacterium]
MRFSLPRVYPLTDAQLSGLSHAEQVRLLSLGGATLIQVREKHLPAFELYGHTKAAVAVARTAGAQLINNDRVDVALAAGAQGVHLGQDDIPPEAARILLGNEAVIGYSTHNLEQALQALTLPIDYIAIGPIFETATKSDPSPTLGLEGLKTVRKAIGDVSLVAIGGISHTNAREVIEAGADCVAVISALLSDPARITDAMRSLLQSLPLPRQT